tara:strand:+ start:30974 stop:31144 length:171 start_codon:yes stop_codon:yes gene_type:complete
MPQSELTKKAIAWIAEMLDQKADQSINVLLEEAAVRFNLSPRDCEFLKRFYTESQT